MPNITSSIQDYCKKINSRITYFDIVSIAVVLLGIAFLVTYFHNEEQKNYKDIIYQEGAQQVSGLSEDNKLPFGSKSGTTYTFSWCQGSARIKEKNKIFFSSEEAAQREGRTLSKLCKK